MISPYRISTMTATGFIGCNINLVNLYSSITVKQLDEEGIIYAEYGNNKHSQISKGTNLKKRFIRVDGKKQASTRRFDNSITVKYNLKKDDHDTSSYSTLNIKIFKNGKIQMTGVKSESNGKKAIQSIIDLIKEYQKTSDENIVEDVNMLRSSSFSIHLINSDFKVDMEIRRDLLANVIINKYSCTCSYEPCIYPGVKLQYYLNKNNKDLPITKQGRCKCSPSCNGKGDGFTTDACKKITISIFQSGCILITGVTLIEHIEIAYNYITELIKLHENEIKRVKLLIEE